ncbi:general secretion pathway protein D [Pseudomonas aeruginosa]|nr:general secretion pathway protein D [Pseudomonas aeruginosa]
MSQPLLRALFAPSSRSYVPAVLLSLALGIQGGARRKQRRERLRPGRQPAGGALDDQPQGCRHPRIHRPDFRNHRRDLRRRPAGQGPGQRGLQGPALVERGLPVVPLGDEHPRLHRGRPGRPGAHRAQRRGQDRGRRRPERAGSPGDAGDPGAAEPGIGTHPADPSAGPTIWPPRRGALGQRADHQRPQRQYRANRRRDPPARPEGQPRLQRDQPALRLGDGRRRGAQQRHEPRPGQGRGGRPGDRRRAHQPPDHPRPAAGARQAGATGAIAGHPDPRARPTPG